MQFWMSSDAIVEDLQLYIQAMTAEIERARSEIDRKRGVASAADKLFKM